MQGKIVSLLRSTWPLALSLVLLPYCAMASEPYGPGEGIITVLIIALAGILANIASLILLLFRPRLRKSLYVLLAISLLFHLVILISYCMDFLSPDSGSNTSGDLLRSVYAPDDQEQVIFRNTLLIILAYWTLTVVYLRIRYKRRKAIQA